MNNTFPAKDRICYSPLSRLPRAAFGAGISTGPMKKRELNAPEGKEEIG